ncbi:protein kinase domain-containing protein [Leptolyngbya sp. AN03gr2]|uniref:protein kinase domain-containing protein n=1 Tax=unclassified Leptolyngbya TaxID=2650499 RepID=UPI003D31E269
MMRKILGRQHRMSQGGGRVTPREYYMPKGVKLAQRYEVLDYLGEGGFSRTYIAGDLLRPGKPRCVVKHLQPANPDPEFLQDAWRLFQQEAEILENLGNHDQIPRLLAYFRDDQEFYLVQEFIAGEPLSAKLIAGQPWQEHQVYQMLIEVLTVLAFVHDHQVIHRDIKPENLICRQADRKLVLVDFGAVKQIRRSHVVKQGHTSVTISVGTLGYMPPEQFSGKPRPSSDIYALGITAIQALTGQSPEAFKDDLDADERSWQQFATVSQPIADVITKMVRYRAIERYQTATQALDDLLQLSAQIEPIATAETESTTPATIVSPAPIAETSPVEAAVESSNSTLQQSEVTVELPKPANPMLEVPEATLVSAKPSDPIPVPAATLVSHSQPSKVGEARSSTSKLTPEALPQPRAPQHRRLAIWIGTGAAISAIVGLVTFVLTRQPQSAPPAPVVQAPDPNPIDSDQVLFNEAVSIAQSGDLEKAIETIQTISNRSSLHSKAQEKVFSWQARLIQSYLRSEIPRKNPDLKDLIDAIKPTVEKLDAEQITIRYDSSANPDFSSDRGHRIITALFMGRLRGNPREDIPAYKNLTFNQIQVFHAQGDQTAVLTERDWNAYVNSTADEETLFGKVQMVARK